MSCWAAAAVILLRWKNAISFSELDLAEMAGSKFADAFKNDTGLNPLDIREFAASLGLVIEAPQNYEPQAYHDLVKSHGPLWVVSRLDVNTANPGGCTRGSSVVSPATVHSAGRLRGSWTLTEVETIRKRSRNTHLNLKTWPKRNSDTKVRIFSPKSSAFLDFEPVAESSRFEETARFGRSPTDRNRNEALARIQAKESGREPAG